IDLRLVVHELPPGLGHVRLHLVARRIEIEPPLTECLLGLADGGIFGAALIEGHVSWAAIEACNCSSTASDWVEPKFFCTLPTAAKVGTSAPSAILTCCNAMSTLYIEVVINGVRCGCGR